MQALGSVVVSARYDGDRLPIALAFNSIDQPVFTGDPTGPKAGKVALERFRLSDPDKSLSASSSDQHRHTREYFVIVIAPVLVFLPAALVETDLQART